MSHPKGYTGLSDEMVRAELHRVLCMNAQHRSRFTGLCRSAPNIARGLRSRLEAELVAANEQETPA